METCTRFLSLIFMAAAGLSSGGAGAQVGPSPADAARYQGLHAAAHAGDAARIASLAGNRAALNARDANGRTPLHVATFARQRAAIRALAQAGADLNALENDRYDAVTLQCGRPG